jgi:YHS domain-containing protein
MKRIAFLLSLLSLTVLARAADVVNADPHSHVGLQGYDPVGFFADSEAEKGSPFISAVYHGNTYLFSSEEHRAEFARHPAQYLPAYGGYCAFGVSIGKFFPVEIDTWEIVDGRLYFQFNQQVKKMFAEDKSGNFKKAEANWPDLVRAENR